MSENREPYVGKITQKAILFGPEGEVLVTKVDDHWEPPGGKFEFGETLVGGLQRELREELGVDARVGPPVEAAYGGWIDSETGNPLVTLVYRCETDDREVELNDEHDDYEWVSPETAAERLEEIFSSRFARAVERTAALDGSAPFEAVTDPYEDTTLSTDVVLEQLAALRNSERSAETDQV
ncbi:NUDIX domain-containing protein [Haladaptatus sp. NG-SE-30]